jgi:hypothetical protein
MQAVYGLSTGGYCAAVPHSRAGMGLGLGPRNGSTHFGGSLSGRSLSGVRRALDLTSGGGGAGAAPPVVRLLRTQLTEQQAAIHRVVLAGHSVCLSGGAGSGKSALLSFILEELRQAYGDRRVCVAAPTGAAAQLVPGGTTLHSFAGFPTNAASVSASELVRNMPPHARRRWSEVTVLGVDEISMVSGVFLDRVSEGGAHPAGQRSAPPPGCCLALRLTPPPPVRPALPAPPPARDSWMKSRA